MAQLLNIKLGKILPSRCFQKIEVFFPFINRVILIRCIFLIFICLQILVMKRTHGDPTDYEKGSMSSSQGSKVSSAPKTAHEKAKPQQSDG